MARERRNRTRLHYAIPPVNKGAQRYVRYVGVAPSTDMLGSVWDDLGITLGSVWVYFGIILGSCWDKFGIILG